MEDLQIQKRKEERNLALFSSSNTEFLKLIHSDNISNLKTIEEIFKNDKFKKKVKTLLNFYEPRQQNESSTILTNKQFYNKKSVNDIFKEIILKVSDSLVKYINKFIES